METRSIAILTENSELVKDVRANVEDNSSRVYSSVDSLRRENYEIIFVDFDLININNSSQFLLSRIRKKMHNIPIILVFQGRSAHQIDLSWFFDDFILYPFRKNEILIRVEKLLVTSENSSDLLVVGELKMDIHNYSVLIKNSKIDLTYKEFELLRLFLENRGDVFSRSDLLNKIWGMEYIGGTRTVDVHIRRLRGKLGEEFNTIIETIRNVGYMCKK